MAINSPTFLSYTTALRVIFLTCCLSLGSCSFYERHLTETCKTRAYLDQRLDEYINARFHSKAPVRLAVVPFSVPANLAQRGSEEPGLGNELAWITQREMLSTELVPIVEVFNRVDWPGKKDEFFTGNFGAISFAREAGYDLVLVGLVEPLTSTDSFVVHTKIIDVESGTTVSFLRSTVKSYRPTLDKGLDLIAVKDYKPSVLYSEQLTEATARCIVHGIKGDEY